MDGATPQTPSGAITARALAREAFAGFGDVLDGQGLPDKLINNGRCGRYHDRARLDMAASGRVGISVFAADCYALPHTLDLMERHPLGSQAFLPLHSDPFLIIVAEDHAGEPGRPQAFVSQPGQGINYHRNTWHGVLTPIVRPCEFAVIDWIGVEDNLQEHHFDKPWHIHVPNELLEV